MRQRNFAILKAIGLGNTDHDDRRRRSNQGTEPVLSTENVRSIEVSILPIAETVRAAFGTGHPDAMPDNMAAERQSIAADPMPSASGPHVLIPRQDRFDDARFWLAAIADSSYDAIVGKDLNGLVTSWNKAAETMFGYTIAEIVGQPITRIVPWDRIDEEASILERVRGGENIVQFETKRQCKDGRIIPVSLTLSPIRDDGGSIIGVSKTARDLSEMQRIHADKERGEALLRSILDTVPDAMIVIDKQGAVHSFSVAAVRLFGYTSAEMIGCNISVLLPSIDWQQHNPEATGVAATGERPIIAVGQRRNRATFPVKLTVGEVNLPRTRLFTAFVHDQTEPFERERELRAANAELERQARNLATERDVSDRANRAKSRFLAGMTHELRTPLNGMVGYAELLRAEGGLNVTQSERVAAMLGAGKHLLQTITRVLDLSEIEAEHVELQAVELDVLAVAISCLDLVRPQADAKRLPLSISVARDTRHAVVTDPARLRQILINLLGNAVKFTSKGSVELRLRHVTDAFVLRIEVADTGPGIPAAERRRLFRDFERLDNNATRTVEATGLGLGLSARLAALLGGCLGHHDNPGGGSVFWLELPLDTVATSPMPQSSADATGASADIPPQPAVALRILAVDNIAMNRNIAGAFLRAAGHDVICVEGGAQAVTAVENTDFDVVLMDVRMPEMDGLEATRQIRTLAGARGRVPIVALTARNFTQQVEECRSAGMSGHVSKPFDPETLLSAVLRAAEAIPIHHATFGPASPPPVIAMPVVGSDIMVFNPAAFERTANYLAPDVVASYLGNIAERGEALLIELRAPDALARAADELADSAHALAGSAGLLGFERLTAIGRKFARAAHACAAEAPSLAESLGAALEVTLQTISDRTLVAADA